FFEHIGARIPRCPRAVQRERWAACQTALLSAINAATLKPTQSAMWLRRPVPPAERNNNAAGDRLDLPGGRVRAVGFRHRAALRGMAALPQRPPGAKRHGAVRALLPAHFRVTSPGQREKACHADVPIAPHLRRPVTISTQPFVW